MIHSVDNVLRSVGRSYPVLEAQRVPLRYAILPSRPTIVAAVQVCKSPVKVCLYVSLLSTTEKRVQKLRLHNRLVYPAESAPAHLLLRLFLGCLMFPNTTKNM